MDPASDGTRGHALFVVGAAALAILVIATTWLGPGGCRSTDPGAERRSSEAFVERPARPRSPLDGLIARSRTGTDGASAGAAAPEPPAERPRPPTEEPEVRIRVAALRGPPAELSARGGFIVHDVAGSGETRPMASPLVVVNDGSAWLLREGAGASSRQWRIAGRNPLEVHAANDATPITFSGHHWPGSMRLHAVGESPVGIDVVVRVGLERYLPGVLAKELYRNWRLETYLAQAVAARSYAVAEADYWRTRRHFDMVAGEASQAWIGETDNANARRAVAETRGMVLVYDGRVVPAYYSSCCGGAAADAIDAVTRNPNHDIPPLALGRDGMGRRTWCCAQAPTATWTERLPVEEVARRLSAWGRENGRPDLASLRGVASIRVASVNAAGRTRVVEVIDGRGAAIDVDAEVFRAAMNGAPADPAASASAGAAPRRTLKSSNVDISIEGRNVVLRGRGHGHGVGLCQYGAEAMSKSGRSWHEILSVYYPGATPKRCW